MSFGQVSRGMRVCLQGLEGTESHLNGRHVTVIATQPATGFCTVECDDRSSWHVEPLNMCMTTSGDGGTAEKTLRWKAVVGADGRTYYHNVETNETSWQRPAELDQPVAASPPTRQQHHATGLSTGLSQAMGGLGVGSTGLGVGSTRAAEAASFRGGGLAPAPAPIITDWKEVSSADGRTYYHNQRTNETAWERPAEMDPPPAAAAPAPERRRQRRVDAPDSHPASSHMGEAPSRTGDAHAFLSALDPVVASAPPPVAPAPATHWREVSSADGRTYYHNQRTNETAWQRPAEMDPPRPPSSPPPPPPPPPPPMAPMPPPSDWKEVRSSDGRTYYHNQRTNETAWQRPAELDAPPPPSQPEPEGRRRRRYDTGGDGYDATSAASTYEATRPTTQHQHQPHQPHHQPQHQPHQPAEGRYPAERDAYGRAGGAGAAPPNPTLTRTRT